MGRLMPARFSLIGAFLPTPACGRKGMERSRLTMTCKGVASLSAHHANRLVVSWGEM